MAVNTRLPLPDSYQSYLRRVIQDGGIYEQIPTVQFLDQYNKIVAYNPSLVMFPSAEKPGTLYTVTPNTSSADFTVTRASSGSYFDRNGILRTAVANEPRLDWNPITRQFNGVLIEPAATNLLVGSEEFENASWIKNESSIINNSTISPSGVQNADSFIENTATALHQCIFTTSAASGTYTATIYAKPNGRNWLFFNIAAAANYGVWFDIQNGVVGTIQSNITSASITNAGNGWYRCIITANTGAISPRISLTLSTGNNNISYLGNGTSGIFIWGAQLELGANATSYIPTVASTVTRNADVIDNTNMSTLIGQTEGAMYIDFNHQRINPLADSFIATISNGVVSNSLVFAVLTNGDFAAIVRTSGTTVIFISIPAASFTFGRKKIVISYKSGNTNLYVNGVKIGSTNTTAFTFPVTINKFNLGSSWSGGSSLNGTLNSAALWKTTLTDAQAINLTSL